MRKLAKFLPLKHQFLHSAMEVQNEHSSGPNSCKQLPASLESHQHSPGRGGRVLSWDSAWREDRRGPPNRRHRGPETPCRNRRHTNSKDERIQLDTLKYLTDRAHGKPAQAVIFSEENTALDFGGLPTSFDAGKTGKPN